MPYIVNEQEENRAIVRKYRELLTVVYPKTDKDERKAIRKAFVLATNAHNGVRRKSGEPYIYHPIAVAMICCKEMNLGATSVICALLHDVVEDTDYTLENMRDMFGDLVAEIIDGLTKIEDLVFDNNMSIQAENFKKIFLSMSKDVRVILIKLADRLHNMRTLDSMPPEKQLKIASETSYFYVPFAHRLGLYTIKSELEDYAMKYTNPTEYYAIAERLKGTEEERTHLIEEFVKPIKENLEANGIHAEISSRTKSIYSIHQKIIRKNVNFEDIYDIFAVRFVFDSPIEEEFEICWKIYKIVCLLYQTNPSRDRNFLTHPKANGYQSLHLTAMSKAGKWVEVQIRSKRMDEIAEKGLAAHYKYKEDGTDDSDVDARLEDWLLKTREILMSKDSDALDFLNEVRLNLCPPVFDQYLAAEFLSSGALDRNLQRSVTVYRRRRDKMVSLLEKYMPEGVSWTYPEGGLFLWLTLPEGMDTVALYDRALAAGVAYVAGSFFFKDGSHRNTMRLNFSFIEETKMEPGIKLLASLLRIPLYKFSGAGNDFVVLDGREGGVDAYRQPEKIQALCKEHHTDGLMILGQAPGYDFTMEFFNPDGSGGMMCGNGGRCIVAFADYLGLKPASGVWNFLAPDGPHTAEILMKEDSLWTVKLKMIDVNGVKPVLDGYFLNTGTRHFVKFVPSVEGLDMEKDGPEYRWANAFQPEGANANFVEVRADGLHVRTFEKGVEAETLACGTGLTASAIAAYTAGVTGNLCRLQCRRGDWLEVSFRAQGEHFTEVYLTGPAELVKTL